GGETTGRAVRFVVSAGSGGRYRSWGSSSETTGPGRSAASVMATPSGRKTAAVAAPHPAAAAAGREILLRGGNAVDAAVGAMLACCVAEPGMVGLGGYGGSLVAFLAGEGRAVAIDFDSRAPLAYRPELFGGREEYAAGY